MEIENFYKNKKIFITGHTGFKGCWLSWWLNELGAEVTGYALPPEDIRGNLYNLSNLKENVTSIEGDIRNLDVLTNEVNKSKAEIIFHLAAQPLVLRSYENPVENYDTNVMGTVNVLEVARQSKNIKAAVIITTDKCYENKEWDKPYKETDELGGRDPYSSSKAMAELAVSSYARSFLFDKGIGVATARAGNVIGGGDFAPYRIFPDIIEAITKDEPVVLRNPQAVRPWQHILDVLYAYLILGKNLYQEPKKFSTCFNISPDQSDVKTVLEITNKLIARLERGSYHINKENNKLHEANYLSLDSTKAKELLGWKSQFYTEQAIEITADWYKEFLNNQQQARAITLQQIKEYSQKI